MSSWNLRKQDIRGKCGLLIYSIARRECNSMNNDFEALAKFYGVSIIDFDFPSKIRGVYQDGVIGINTDVTDPAERRCIIACEMGRHLMRGYRGIVLTEEQENIIAFYWAVSYIMPLSALIEALKFENKTVTDVAAFLNVTPQFVKTGLAFYKNSMGSRIFYHNHVIDLEKEIVDYSKVG